PPVVGIFQRGAAGNDAAVADARTQLAHIFKGLLHANNNYAAVSLVSRDHGGREIVRVTRTGTGRDEIGVVRADELGGPGYFDAVRRNLVLKPHAVTLSDVFRRPADPSHFPANA